MKKTILVIVFMMAWSVGYSKDLDVKIKDFADSLRIKSHAGIVIGDITHLQTGKKWDLSRKIESSLVRVFQEKFTLLDRTMEKQLAGERLKSISGYTDVKADYILTGVYEVNKDDVRIELKILDVDSSELVDSRMIIVDRADIEMYLVDYSENELDMIIEKQNAEIKALLNKQEAERQKALKLLQIKQQRQTITRINEGKSIEPKENRSGKFFLYGLATGAYGYINFLAAEDLDNSGRKDAAQTAREFGNIFYAVSAGLLTYAGYLYFSEDTFYVRTIQLNKEGKLTLTLSRNF